MESTEAVLILAALGQRTRLDTFRLLVKAGQDGMAASDIAASMGVPRNTMSSHLAILARAGLVQSTRIGTQITYRPDLSRLTGLTAFLVEGCCGGQPEQCEPGLSELRHLTPSETDPAH